MIVKKLQEENGWDRAQVLGLARFLLTQKGGPSKYVTALGVHRLCTNMNKMFSSDVMSLSSACRAIIHQLEEIPSTAFMDREWTSLIQCLTQGTPLLTGTVQNCINSEETDVAFECPSDVKTEDSTNVTREVCRLNAAFITGSDIFLRTVYKLFSKQQLDQAEKAIKNELIEWNKGGASLADNADKVSLMKDLLACPWAGFSEQLQKVLRSVGTCVLYLAGSLPVSESPASLEEQFVSDAISLHLATLQLTAFSLADSKNYCSLVMKLYCQIVEKMFVSNHLVATVQGILSVLPFFNCDPIDSLAGVLWRSASVACTKISSQPIQTTHDADIPKVAIASPESDLNWIDSILESVPAIFDRRSLDAHRSANYNSTLLSVAIRCLEALSQLPKPFDNNFKEVMTVATEAGKLGDVQLLAQFGQIYRHLLECGAISQNIQEELVKQLLTELDNVSTNEGVCDILGSIVRSQSAVNESTAARCVVDYAVEKAKSKKIDKFTMELIRGVACELSLDDRSTLLKKFIPIIHGVAKSDSSDEQPALVVNLLHFLHVLMKSGGELVDFELFYAKKIKKPMDDPRDQETVSPIYKHACDLSFTGYSDEQWAEFVCDIASVMCHSMFTHRPYPAEALPPINRNFLEKLKVSTDLNILTFFFRQYNLLFNESNRNFLKNFNSSDSGFEDALFAVLSRDTACPLAITLFGEFEKELDSENSSVSVVLQAADAVFSLLASSLTFTPALCEAIIRFTEFLEKKSLTLLCISLDSESAVDRIHSLLRIKNNPVFIKYLHNAGETMVESSIHPEVLDFVNSFVSPQMVGAPTVEMDWEPFVPETDTDDVVLRLLYHQLTKDLLARLEVPESTSVGTIRWLFKTHALQTIGEMEKSNDVAARTCTESDLLLNHTEVVVSELLHGIADSRPKAVAELISFPDLFVNILSHLMLKNNDLPWERVSEQTCGSVVAMFEDSHSSHHLSVPFLKLLRILFQDENKYQDAALRVILGPFEKNIAKLSLWLLNTPNSLHMWNETAVLLRHCQKLEHCREDLNLAISSCIDVILKSSVLDELHSFYPIQVQTTDRFAQSLLKWRGTTSRASWSGSQDSSASHPVLWDISHEAIAEGHDPVKDAFALLCEFSTSATHVKMATLAKELISEWLSISELEEKVLQGRALLDDNDKRIVWRMILLSNLLSYVSEVADQLNASDDEVAYFSDDEPLKETILHKPYSLSSSPPPITSRPKNDEGMLQKPLCTFASTEKEFINQHWYNCHTCKMTDTVGVCSVCALNCHRGHDLSYSKRGSFFCDCGAKGCESLRSVSHDASNIRGCTRGAVGSSSSRASSNIHSDIDLPTHFENIELDGLDAQKIRDIVIDIRDVLEQKAHVVEKFYRSIKSASEARWTLADRRQEAVKSVKSDDYIVKYNETLMTSTHITRIEALERRGEGSGTNAERLMGHETAGVVRTSSGRSILILLNESATTLSVVHTSDDGKLVDDNNLPEWRVDIEPVGFLAKRIACRDDKCAVVGSNECLLMRFGRDADIVDRLSIRLPENAPTNPIVKAEWAVGNPLLAIATQQFVRIFNACKDLDQCVEELVLPLGNVTDVCLVAREGGGAWVLVLSSVGHLYVHVLNTQETADNSSYFLTNTISMPQLSNAVSIHYSPTCNLLFVSLQSATYYAQILDGEISLLETSHFKKLQLDEPVHVWQESSGLMACLSMGNSVKLNYIYPTLKQLLIQTVNLARPAYAHLLMTTPTGDGHFSIQLHNGGGAGTGKHCSVWTSNWEEEPDLWITGLPRVVRTTDSIEPLQETLQETPMEDLVTIFEHGAPLEKVEFTSESLNVYYDSIELTSRLNQVNSLAVTVVHKQQFDISCRLLDYNYVVRGVRIEVAGGRAPASVALLGDKYNLATDSNRVFDIRLRRSQSLVLDKAFTLDFQSPTNRPQCSIVSIKVFGVPRREFGWPRPSHCLVSPLSLPQNMLSRLVNLYTVMIDQGLDFKVQNLVVDIGMDLSSPRSAHSILSHAASHLLRVAVKDVNTYYLNRDLVIICGLKRFHVHGPTIPSDLMVDFLIHLKMMVATRWIQFEKLIIEQFNDMVSFCAFLREQLDKFEGDPNGIIEFYCLLIFILLSQNHEQSTTLVHQYFSLFTSPNTTHLAHRVRVIAQNLVQTYNGVARADRSLAKGSGSCRRVMKWGAALPFYGLSKLLSEEADIDDVMKRVGAVITTEQMALTDIFDGECEWVCRLLNGLLEKIRDDGSVGSIPGQGGRGGDAVPATSLIILAIVLMAQLYPARLYPTVSELIQMIDFKKNIVEPKPDHYRQFLLMRLISVLISKCGEHLDNKKKGRNSKDSSPQDEEDPSSITTEHAFEVEAAESRESTPLQGDDKPKRTTTGHLLEKVVGCLLQSGAMASCFTTLESLAPYWRNYTEPQKAPRSWSREVVPGDLSYLSAAGGKAETDANENYRALLTEVALRLPLQMKKINKQLTFDPKWEGVLCSLITCQNAANVRRSARKLLMALCEGDKQAYRLIRDKHLITGHISMLNSKYVSSSQLSHKQLTEMVEIVNGIASIAQERTAVWRQICGEQLNWLLSVACKVADAVSGRVVELLVTAIRASPDGDQTKSDGEEAIDDLQNENDPLECQLADQMIVDDENRALFKMLLVRYLIGRDENRRWLLHGMVRSTIQLASRQNQVTLMRILWTDLWPLARGLGTHGAQLADILSTYAPRLLPTAEFKEVAQQEIEAIGDAIKRMQSCGHDSTYRQMSGLGLSWKDAMLMDTSPCLVCSSKQDTLQTMKLSSMKQDSRFTTNAQMIKLAGHYEVSRVVIKLNDIKRQKSIKKVVLHYCQKVVESAVDLKNSPELWQKAATANVSLTDTEICLSVAIPVVTSGLIVEFTELHDQRSAAELHCPRCSSVVQPNPGVCENCGENVFQCVKCRAINYDEKEPFLCNSCGFCKYARMDIVVVCRPLPSVYPITNDQERTQSIEAVGKLLIDMEQTRCSLIAARALGEALWLKTKPFPTIALHVESWDHANTLANAAPQLNPTQSNVANLAMCTAHCKAVHEELCNQTSQLIAFREELRAFERNNGGPLLHQALNLGFYSTSAHCFGCICASVIHSVSILSAACDDSCVLEKIMDNDFIWNDLVKMGLKYDPLRDEIELLLCRLAFDNEKGTEKLCALATSNVISGTILARSLLQFPDSMWQRKLKTLMQVAVDNPSDENTSLSLLTVLDRYLADGREIKRRAQVRRQMREGERKTRDYGHTPSSPAAKARRIRMRNPRLASLPSIGEWMNEKGEWAGFLENGEPQQGDKDKHAHKLLTEKYSWWLWECVFSSWVSVRAASSRLLLALAKHPGHAGTAVALVITGITRATLVRPGRCDHFYRVAHRIVTYQQVKLRLFAANFHIHLVNLIYKECAAMHEEELMETTMDHWFGHRLRNYVELLCLLFSGSQLESCLLRAGRVALLLPLFQSTVYLKRILLKRTRAVDASRQALEKLLKRVSAKEPEHLLRAAVESLDLFDDFNTQAHIISVIVDVIHPVQKDDEEFHLQIEKDPAQEDFLQGRMSGNPYKSSDHGMGPLMRDVKNKICRDCELVALLEDDNGMELLVDNKIVALWLPVKAVWEKLWRKDHPGQPMTIVYRMRGLLGDAVEQFISNLSETGTGDNEVDDTGASLTRSLSRFGGVVKAFQLVEKADLTAAGRFLFSQLKKLFDRCLLVEDGRSSMVQAGAVQAFLKVIHMCIEVEGDEAVMAIGVDYLKMLETLVCDLNMHEKLEGVSAEEMKWLLSLAMERETTPSDAAARRQAAKKVKVTAAVRETLCKLIPNLCIGSKPAEDVLIQTYLHDCRWTHVDEQRFHHVLENALHRISVLCSITTEILPSKRGNELKQKIIDKGVLKTAADYLVTDHPPLYNAVESPEWKTYLGRPSLKMVLTLMGGMAKGHEGAQRAVAEKSLHILHRLEQVASADCVGTLAENVVEALNENEEVAAQIKSVREETKQKKRQLAMQMRQKQLTRMGMQLGKAGEVKVSSRKIANEPQLDDVALDPLQSCCICRESISAGPRVPCVYAYALPVEFILTASDGTITQPGYCTVSQMVLVHMDCHQNAIRRTGGRGNSDEWSKASLHNAGALCNVLIPIPVADPSHSDWKGAVQRAQADISIVSPASCALNRANIFMDICQLIDRFINQRSFSEHSKGGGRESNAQYLCILHLLALSMDAGDEDLPARDPAQRVVAFLLTELTVDSWKEQRADVLRGALEDASRAELTGWSGLKPVLLTWAFVDSFFSNVITITGDDRLQWLKDNFVESLKKSARFIKNFDEDVCPVDNYQEFADVCSLNVDDLAPFFLE